MSTPTTGPPRTRLLVTQIYYYTFGGADGGLQQLVNYPDRTRRATVTTTTGTDRTVEISEGAPATLATGISSGTKTTLIFNKAGQLYHKLVSSIYPTSDGNNIVLEEFDVGAWDGDRATSVTYFPGSSQPWTETATYDCCGVASRSDKFGITTYYAYDDAKRLIRANNKGVTLATVYDGLSEKTYRYAEAAGPPSTTATLSSSFLVGEEVSDKSREVRISKGVSPADGSFIELSRTTTEFKNGVAGGSSLSGSEGKKVVTEVVHVADDGGSTYKPKQTVVYYGGGMIASSSGDLEPSKIYDYTATTTVVGGVTYRGICTSVYLGPSTPSSPQEFVKKYTDWSGGEVDRHSSASGHTVYAYNPGAQYGGGGHLASSTDADGYTTLYAYNSRGQRTTSGVDADHDGTMDWGVEQISSSEEIYAAHGSSTGVIRTVNKAWKPGGTEVVLSYDDRTPNGLQSWHNVLPGSVGVSSERATILNLPAAGSPGTWNVTTSEADGRTRRAYYTSGRLTADCTWEAGVSVPASAPGLATASLPNLLAGTAYAYDTMGRVSTKQRARTDLNTIGYISTTCDSIASLTEPPAAGSTANRVTSYGYDHRGRKTLVHLPGWTSASPGPYAQSFSYYMDGLLKDSSGGRVYHTAYIYDYADRMATLTTYGTSTAVTTWTYDSTTGLMAGKTDDTGKTVSYGYSAGGRLKGRTWARGAFTRYDYDTSGRLGAKRYFLTAAAGTGSAGNDGNTPDLEYFYDSLGRLDHVNRGGALHYSYTFDANNLLVKTERQNDVPATFQTYFPRLLTRKTDGLLRPAGYIFGSPSDPDGISEVSYTYSSNRLSTVTYQAIPGATSPPAPEVFSYKYGYSRSGGYDSWDTSSSRTGLLPFDVEGGGSASSPVVRSLRRYESSRNVLNWINNLGSIPGVVSSSTYAVNDLGQRTEVSKVQGTTTADTIGWAYDNLGQVSGATSANHASTDDRSYAYDGIGNRTSSTAAGATTAYWANTTGTTAGANNLNQYKKVGASSAITYDDDGNMLYDGTKWTCTWDGENRLIQAEQTPVVTDSQKLVYNYDYMGRMFLRTTYKYLSSGSYNSGERFGLTYDGWNRIDSQVDWNWLHDEYVWGLDVGGTRRGAGGVGGMLMWKGTTDASTSGNNNYTYYPAYDGNGNVTDLITPAGIAGAHWEYDPFGKILRTLSTPAAGMDPGTYFEFKFSTKPVDRSTGLYYYGYRFYQPDRGQWLSRDPAGERGGSNLSGVCGNNLVGKIDYLGLYDPYNPEHSNPETTPPSPSDNAGPLPDLSGIIPALSADIGLGGSASLAGNLSGLTAGVEVSVAVTYKLSTGCGPQVCVSCTISPKAGLGIGEATAGVGLVGSAGTESFVGAGPTTSVGAGANVAFADVGLSGGGSVAAEGSGWGGSVGGGDPLGYSAGGALNAYLSKSYSGKVCENLKWWDPTGQNSALPAAAARTPEACKQAYDQAKKDNFGVPQGLIDAFSSTK